MDAAAAAGLAAPGAARTFVTNQLIVVLPNSNPGGVQTLQDLAWPGLKLVLADEEVPAGRYARQVLDRLNASYGASFREDVLANVVSNEDNVKQVVAKVQLGEADAGIVYASDALAARSLSLSPFRRRQTWWPSTRLPCWRVRRRRYWRRSSSILCFRPRGRRF